MTSLGRVVDRLLGPVRSARRAAARWSASEDRRFHDELFAGRSYDPFSASYPGYITIRRFADLAAARFGSARHVLDLGCGPGEITCELARRYPEVSFVGVDHSGTAIERANQLANVAGVSNVRFERGDIAAYAPPARVDLVVMFDSFHHLTAPREFVTHASTYADRFLLIEPAGDALGRWRRSIDCDWIALELDTLRARIEHTLGVPRPTSGGADAPDAETLAGRATENRYTEDDYTRFFDGLSVSFRGTVAGLGVYPPQPAYDSVWRRRMMDVAYQLLAEIDEDLYERGLDAYAKHWAIYVEKDGPGFPSRPRRAFRPPPQADTPIQGAYDVRYAAIDVPEPWPSGSDVTLEVEIRNMSWREWASTASPPVFASYHWLASDRRVVEYDGIRTPLPYTLGPGQSCRAAVRVRPPAAAGRYVLEIDLVEEGVTWFSAAGAPPLRLPAAVR